MPSTTKYSPDDVHDPDDWRTPIAVWSTGKAVLAIYESIRFMTGTEPKVALDNHPHALSHHLRGLPQRPLRPMTAEDGSNPAPPGAAGGVFGCGNGAIHRAIK